MLAYNPPGGVRLSRLESLGSRNLFQQFRRSTLGEDRGKIRPNNHEISKTKNMYTVNCWETPHAKSHSGLISFILAYNPKKDDGLDFQVASFSKKNMETLLPSPGFNTKGAALHGRCCHRRAGERRGWMSFLEGLAADEVYVLCIKIVKTT